MALNQHDLQPNYLFSRKGRLKLLEKVYLYTKQLEDTPKFFEVGYHHKNYKWVELQAKLEICQELLKL